MFLVVPLAIPPLQLVPAVHDLPVHEHLEGVRVHVSGTMERLGVKDSGAPRTCRGGMAQASWLGEGMQQKTEVGAVQATRGRSAALPYPRRCQTEIVRLVGQGALMR